LKPFVDLFKIAISSCKLYSRILVIDNSAVATAIREVLESDLQTLSNVEVMNVVIHSPTDGDNFLQIGKMLMLRSPRFYRFEIHSWVEFK